MFAGAAGGESGQASHHHPQGRSLPGPTNDIQNVDC